MNEEQSKLAECEATIERTLGSFYETGQALQEIRDRFLYRVTYATFEKYCQERWDMGASRARQLIGAAEVVANLQGVTTVTPETERQVRELASLTPEEQRKVWEEAVETAPNGKITADHIRKTREAIINRPEQETLLTLEDYRQAIADHVDAANRHRSAADFHKSATNYHVRQATHLRDEAFKKFGEQIPLPFNDDQNSD
jgi:hypothetical protein